jgi:hypothetical protein
METRVIDALNKAIDEVTFSTLEKLAQVKARVTLLEDSIKQKNEEIKKRNADLIASVIAASAEVDVMQEKLDVVENNVLEKPALPIAADTDVFLSKLAGSMEPQDPPV